MIGIEQKTIDAAQSFYDQFDEEGLLVVLGKQDKAIEIDSSLASDPTLDPEYDSTHMGLVDDLKSIGMRVMNRWNRELNQLVCGKEVNENHEQLIKALNLSEAAAVATVASMLLAIAPAAVAAPLAALLVKSILLPAKEELCDAWSEALDS